MMTGKRRRDRGEGALFHEASGRWVGRVVVTSSVAAAEIEVDGAFVGNTPTALHLSPGSHRVVVKHGTKVWERTLQVTAGSEPKLTAPVSVPFMSSVLFCNARLLVRASVPAPARVVPL